MLLHNMKLIFLILIFSSSIFLSKGNQPKDLLINNDSILDTQPNHAVSTHLFSVFLGRLKLGYEFRLNRSTTIKVMPMFGYSQDFFYFYGVDNLTQYGAEAQVKFYTQSSAMKGFYLSPIFFYNRFKYDYCFFNSIMEFDPYFPESPYGYVDNTYDYFRAGLVLGYQFNISKRTFIDINLGPAYSFYGSYLDIFDFNDYEKGFLPHFNFSIGTYLK